MRSARGLLSLLALGALACSGTEPAPRAVEGPEPAPEAVENASPDPDREVEPYREEAVENAS
ncbi:MAG: hypothetical protein J4F50_11770, partial [Acidimicrobiia bacterium]|nr:hypothetical protein [Acidimicrobiia bacterium]